MIRNNSLGEEDQRLFSIFRHGRKQKHLNISVDNQFTVLNSDDPKSTAINILLGKTHFTIQKKLGPLLPDEEMPIFNEQL